MRHAPAALVALALVLAIASCGDDPADVCASVKESSCPGERPNANPDFPYDTASCEEALESACETEFQQYLDCLVADPTCCADPAADGSIDCDQTDCDQAAYGDCVSAL